MSRLALVTGSNFAIDDTVQCAWAPAGWGRIVVVLGQGVVVHKVVASSRAAAEGIVGDGGTSGTVGLDQLRASPFLAKVLRDGVPGLLASPRKTLLGWDSIVAAERRGLVLGRGRMIIRTADAVHRLKFLQNTLVVGDPDAVFGRFLGERFTAP